MSTFEILLAPCVACLLLTGIHCYLGLHVVSRGVIFVDLALAQLAALGSAVGLLWGMDNHGDGTYWVSLAFTLIGAAVFALTRTKRKELPQEAMIGIVYAVSSAFTVLALDRSPHGHEELRNMLMGSILFVSWVDIAKTALLYGVIGALHFVWRKRFLKLSLSQNATTDMSPRQELWWDFLFYASFGFVVTSSVKLAGVLLVFSFLIIPAVCAMLFATTLRGRLLFGWAFSSLVSVAGLYASSEFDLPTGAAIVAVFGFGWLGSLLVSRFA